MLRRNVLIVLLLLGCFGALQGNTAQGKLSTKKIKEYKVKAAFVYNMLKFIDWPKQESATTTSDEKNEDKTNKVFTIGFIADKEIFEACKGIRGKKIKGKTIQTVLFDSVTEKDLKAGDTSKTIKALKGCDVLYICDPQSPQSQQPDFRKVLATLKGLTILTIGETDGFLKSVKPTDPCGIINFVVDDNKVRFEINLDKAQENGFQLKAQLLKLAKEVIKKPKPTK